VSSTVTIPIEFEQEVGERSNDVLVIGWIDGTQISLDTGGVQTSLTTVLPPGGISSSDSDETKVVAALLIGQVAMYGVNAYFELGTRDNPIPFNPFSDADRHYTLYWMFKYANNPTPPDSFCDSDGHFSQESLQGFLGSQNQTLYKLVNHYQVRFVINNVGKFLLPPVWRENQVRVGNTKDPSHFYEVSGFLGAVGWVGTTINPYPAGGVFVGQPGPNNGNVLQTESESKLCNSGRPDQHALNAFLHLIGQDQGQIWSTITFFSDMNSYSETISNSTGDSLSRAPFPQNVSESRVNTQVYPTYSIYWDGQLVGVQTQAPSPMALFPNTDQAQ
jgi:hypothetical protein